MCFVKVHVQWAATVLHAAAENYIFLNANILGHRQDIEVLLTVLNVAFALVLLRKQSANCRQ
jgi:hypothetical protein